MGKEKIKILGISCGHRKGRNTAWLTLYALKAAEKFGRRISEVADIETEFIDLWGKKISPRMTCDIIDGDYRSLVEEDYITRELMPKIAEADGLVFGCPVFTSSYTSSFIKLIEHLRIGIKHGYYTNKPAGTVTVATMMIGGQEPCLGHMNMCIRSLGMIPVNWLNGACGVSGIPYGPMAGKDDGTVIALQKDRFAQWGSVFTGRRVAEVAVKQRLAKRRLGDLYHKEFIQVCGTSKEDESWNWKKLGRDDEKYVQGLEHDDLMALDGKIVKPEESNNKPVCKIVGFSCDDHAGRDTSWLVVNSLKAIEEFGRRIDSVCSFETEYVDMADKQIRACFNCDKRYEIPHGAERWSGPVCPDDKFGCIIRNDYMSKEVLPRVESGDGFIIGSSVCGLATSVTFRLFHERFAAGIFKGHTSSKPTANIAVAYGGESGQETCLNVMNTCNRWVELIPVGWPHGTPASGGPITYKNEPVKIAVKEDQSANELSILNARRVAEFALVNKLAKQELGDVFSREFYEVIHPPHGNATWEWSRLDNEEHEYMLNLTPETLAELGK